MKFQSCMTQLSASAAADPESVFCERSTDGAAEPLIHRH